MPSTVSISMYWLDKADKCFFDLYLPENMRTITPYTSGIEPPLSRHLLNGRQNYYSEKPNLAFQCRIMAPLQKNYIHLSSLVAQLQKKRMLQMGWTFQQQRHSLVPTLTFLSSCRQGNRRLWGSMKAQREDQPSESLRKSPSRRKLGSLDLTMRVIFLPIWSRKNTCLMALPSSSCQQRSSFLFISTMTLVGWQTLFAIVGQYISYFISLNITSYHKRINSSSKGLFFARYFTINSNKPKADIFQHSIDSLHRMQLMAIQLSLECLKVIQLMATVEVFSLSDSAGSSSKCIGSSSNLRKLYVLPSVTLSFSSFLFLLTPTHILLTLAICSITASSTTVSLAYFWLSPIVFIRLQLIILFVCFTLVDFCILEMPLNICCAFSFASELTFIYIPFPTVLKQGIEK